MTKKALTAEYGQLVDERFLGRLTPAKAARLDQVKDELKRLDAPRVRALQRRFDQEDAAIEAQISALRAKVVTNASGRPQAKSASSH